MVRFESLSGVGRSVCPLGGSKSMSLCGWRLPAPGTQPHNAAGHSATQCHRALRHAVPPGTPPHNATGYPATQCRRTHCRTVPPDTLSHSAAGHSTAQCHRTHYRTVPPGTPPHNATGNSFTCQLSVAARSQTVMYCLHIY